jgi:hypothetical protein
MTEGSRDFALRKQFAPHSRYRRRLSDDLLIAFHAACDQDDLEIARHLIGVLEFSMRRPSIGPKVQDSRARRSLVAAHERLWDMQHRELLDAAPVTAMTTRRADEGSAGCSGSRYDPLTPLLSGATEGHLSGG